MRVVVTGGAGFIGSHVARRLLKGNHEVVILDDLSTGLMRNVPPGARFSQCDLSDLQVLVGHVNGWDAIVHLAARGSVPRSILDPIATHKANATGTLNVLEAARRVGASVVWSSSSSVYGGNTQIPKDEGARTEPITPYAASKLAGESYARSFGECYDMTITTLRFFNVFGPRQRPDHDYAAVIPKWIWAALHGQPLRLNGDGTTSRDFTFVDDVVSVIERATTSRMSHPSPINVAFGRSTTLREVLKSIESLVGLPVHVHEGPERAGDIRHSLNDPTLLHQCFPGIEPTAFDRGLEQTIDWLRIYAQEATSHRPNGH